MAKLHIRRTIIFIILGAICGFLYVMFTPKVYEGSVQLMIANLGQRGGADVVSPDVQKVLDAGASRNPLSELSVLRGRGLFFTALERLSQEQNDPDMLTDFERYYGMYDVLGEKESDTVVLQARAFTPENAANLANYITEEYNNRRLAVANQATDRAIKYLEAQIADADKGVQDALEARRKYKEENAIANLEAAISQSQVYETQTRGELSQAQSNLAATEREVAAARSALDAAAARKPGEVGTVRNPAINKLENDLADLRSRRASLLAQYNEDHWNVKSVDDAIVSVQRELNAAKRNEFQTNSKVDRPDPLAQSLESQYTGAVIRRNAIQGQLAKIQANYQEHQNRLRFLTGAERKMADLDRDVAVKESAYRNLKIQHESLRTRNERGAILATILFPARAFPDPVYPNVVIVALLSVFGGGALGILYSFVVESLRLRIYTSWQLADLTGLPVVASLPRLPAGMGNQIAGSLAGDSPRIMESIRLLAFSLAAQPHEGCKRLMFTGLDRKTGTTSCAAQLAIALGHTGAKVIFVDGDLIAKEASRVFKAETQKGLAEALQTGSTTDSLGEYLRDSGNANVKFLPAGVVNDRALRESETVKLEETLKWLSDRCDYLIVDCPPCLRNSEAARLAAETDESYLVVSLRISSVPVVSAALDILRQAGAEVVRLLTTEGDKSEEALARESRVTSASRALPQ
ncbi:MAG TPA: AAA family ATPase [Fimbriimonadaceae bacterium]|nr:AAA family ATPase [Fimbriimonadaceae bacterium]